VRVDSTVSASSSLTIGTDCVGSFGEWGLCSSVCGVGERSQIYTIVSLQSNSSHQHIVFS
jgi:hypothetical protein